MRDQNKRPFKKKFPRLIDLNRGFFLFSHFLILIFWITLSACKLESPTVQPGWLKAKFSHTGFTDTCIDCHRQDRPTQVIREFDHNHPAGQGDCATCHQAHIGGLWSDGIYEHTPSPSTCFSCHETRRPTGPVGSPPYYHLYQYGTGDCVYCHLQPGDSWNYTPSGEIYSHSPQPSNCIQCHLISRPIGLLTESSFNHDPLGLGDCLPCHSSSSQTRLWSGGFFQHPPSLTSCLGCHTADRPPFAIYPDNGGFVMDHYGSRDCAECHKPMGGSTFRFQFEHTQASGAGVTSCLPCHLSYGQSQSGPNHGPGVADCIACHRTQVPWSSPSSQN
jgi:hypothetical protein